MRKVLFVTTISGFLLRFEKNDVRILQKMGYEVHYASNFSNPIYQYDKGELESMGIISHHIPLQKSPGKIWDNMNAIRKLIRIIDGNGINMIHCHNPMGGVAARVAAKICRRTPSVIYTAHGFHFYRRAPLVNWLFYYPAEKILARWTDVIITINKEDYRLAKKKFRLKREGKIYRIPGVGIDLEGFRPMPEIRDRKRGMLAVPVDGFHIVTAAELNKNKNQSVIIKAIRRTGCKDIYYSICGEGPERIRLLELVRRCHLEKQVQILGFRTDMAELLQSADVFAFPSKREGLGLAALEAMACGVPVIAADNRGTREFCKDDYNAVVCKSQNLAAFEKGISKLYSNRKYREKLASHCRATAEKFSVERVRKTMQQIYEEAASSNEER